MAKRLVYQQGDVLLYAVDSVPSEASPLDHCILAEGEATGHCHEAVGDGVALLEHSGTRYLSALRGARVTHQEHAEQVVDPGVYEVGRVLEYDHFAEEARRVMD